ncbi:hypothetical protein GGR26_002805 [Lewinella marina]|uniref:DUF481 domain-containing protein n=1 Tax=Neolewinella marina TaxID=438751 RepID=A0A2G0CCX5_9BACT|nr:hypothetical protein [Neolewinella marina]NJB87028.1 hypothetical protein [Neolewinella marina]PHK97780.1 hypothetical protein CGL56_13260 [Neolewinella marina]
MRYSLLQAICCLLILSGGLSAQRADSTAVHRQLSGMISATHNGISIIPSFSLDKPALIVNLKMGSRRFTFEPDLRFALEGKPWSMLFWGRYQAVQGERFSLRLGAHPAINFRTVMAEVGGEWREVIETRRYVASEVVPSLRISDRFSLGMYYLHGRGFDAGIKTSNFVQLNAAWTGIALVRDWQLHLFPQFYYLRTDALDGTYVAGAWRINQPGLPFSLSGLVNRSIQTEISPERKWIWNVVVEYRFGGEYRRVDQPVNLR